MTIAELYKWAVDNEVEDYEIGLQYQDDGGGYMGNTYLDHIDVEASIEKSFDDSEYDEYYVLLY